MGNKVYCGNLSWGATEEDLHEVFGQFGTVTEAKVITDRDTGRSKGFAFVTFENAADAQAAVDGMVGQEIDSRPVRVSIAEDRPRKERTQGAGHHREDRGGYRNDNRY